MGIVIDAAPRPMNYLLQTDNQDARLQPGVQQYPHDHGHRHVQRVGLEGQRTLSIPGPMRSIATWVLLNT
jgi:hypothetical protein